MHPARFAVLVEIAPAPQHDEAFFRRPSARGRRARCRGFSCSVATVEVLGASTCHSHRSQRLHCVSRLRGHGKAHPVQLLAVQPWPRASPRTWTSGCCAKHSSHIVGKKLIADPGIAPTPFTQLQIPCFGNDPQTSFPAIKVATSDNILLSTNLHMSCTPIVTYILASASSASEAQAGAAPTHSPESQPDRAQDPPLWASFVMNSSLPAVFFLSLPPSLSLSLSLSRSLARSLSVARALSLSLLSRILLFYFSGPTLGPENAGFAVPRTESRGL